MTLLPRAGVVGPHTPGRYSGIRPSATAIPQPSGHEIQERERLELCGMAPDPWESDFEERYRNEHHWPVAA